MDMVGEGGQRTGQAAACKCNDQAARGGILLPTESKPPSSGRNPIGPPATTKAKSCAAPPEKKKKGSPNKHQNSDESKLTFQLTGNADDSRSSR